MSKFKSSGYQIVQKMKAEGKSAEIKDEIKKLVNDLYRFKRIGMSKGKLSEIDPSWSKLSTGQRIIKGKRIKYYVDTGLINIKGIDLSYDKPNSTIVYDLN